MKRGWISSFICLVPLWCTMGEANFCHSPMDQGGVINIHLVPHSHDDVGWKETLDEYYSQGWIQVKQIYDSVFKGLVQNPERRFVASEMAFFSLWWHDQILPVQQKVRQMVHEGRFQFAGGGWTQNDEAVTHYSAIIDNLSIGTKFIEENFGSEALPKVAWQLDPFGHSVTQALISEEIGFKGMFFQRMNYVEKTARFQNGSRIFHWDLGHNHKKLLTIVIDQYTTRPPFNFEAVFNSQQQASASDVISYVKNTAEVASGLKQVFIPMGGDFQYIKGDVNFEWIDNLIHSMNSQMNQHGMFFMYSTPWCYLKALDHQLLNLTSRRGDFFPYISGGDKIWTGFYTSRPTLKLLARYANSILQIVKQINALFSNGVHPRKAEMLQKSVSILQHHDAITGTEKEHVAKDYVRRLKTGLEEAKAALEANFGDDNACFCHQMAVSLQPCACSQINESNFSIIVYNSHVQDYNGYVKFQIGAGFEAGKIKCENAVTFDELLVIKNMFQNRFESEPKNSEAVFYARNLPALGSTRCFVHRLEEKGKKAETWKQIDVASLSNYLPANLTIQMGYYKSSQDLGNPSGAYIFHVEDENPILLDIVEAKVQETEKLRRVVVHYQNGWSFIATNYEKWPADEIEVTWITGRLRPNQEAFIRYKMGNFINRGGVFFSDSNGLRAMAREMKRNVRLEANFYPVTTSIFIQEELRGRSEKEDTQRELSILTDRSQAGSSLAQGEITLMIHRRLSLDDHMGLDEALDDKTFGQGSHKVCITSQSGEEWRLKESLNLFKPPLTMYYTPAKRPSSKGHFSALKAQLPKGLNFLTMEAWKPREILLRIENLSASTTITLEPHLATLFESFVFKKCQMVNLIGQSHPEPHSCANNVFLPHEIKSFILSW